jgi:hypothetical protein
MFTKNLIIYYLFIIKLSPRIVTGDKIGYRLKPATNLEWEINPIN